MKIESSAVAMSSHREYDYYERKTSASLDLRADEAAKLNFSQEGLSLMEQLEETKLQIKKEEEQKRQQQQQNLVNSLEDEMKRIREANEKIQPYKEEIDWKVKLMRRMLELMKGRKPSEIDAEEFKEASREYKESSSFKVSVGFSIGNLQSAGGTVNVGDGGGVAANSTRWTRTIVESAFVTEREMTAYEAVGYAKTADGREIGFNVTLEMSRAFCAEFESLTQEKYVVTDPLVINLDSSVASVTDQKFLFDLNSDGEKESISFVGEGSGFLAIDKNKDGTINDGSELFGTQSGDGFKDLASYDEDGNGWIDENDSVFKDLRVWTKASDGTDIIMDLKDADVGAIYLGSASTEYSLKNNETYATNGIIRQTGVYLKESGGVSTVQHVDLVV